MDTFLSAFLAIASLLASTCTLYIAPLPQQKSNVDLLEKNMVPVNAAVCMTLIVREFMSSHGWDQSLSVGGEFLPGLVLMFVV